MSVLSYRKPVARKMGGGPPVSRAIPIKTGETFKKGQFVALSSGEAAAIASAATKAAGMAQEDAQDKDGNLKDKALIALAVPENEFGLCVGHVTVASAITAITQAGVRYGVYYTSSMSGYTDGQSYIAIDDTTNKLFIVNSLHSDDAVGDRHGRVWASIPPANSDFGVDVIA